MKNFQVSHFSNYWQNLIYIILISFSFQGCNNKNHDFPSGKWVDLTYPFDENTIYWPTSEPFRLDTVFEGISDKGFYYSAFQYCSAEHGGTHIDAPVHFADGKKSVDQIEIDQLIGKAVVIDISQKCATNPDYKISSDDLINYEKNKGEIPKDAILMLHTGYGKHWRDRLKYLGTNERGPDAVAKLHFPGLSPEASDWLIKNRKVKAIGIDTPSIDFGQSTHFESHQKLFKQNIPAFENVANMDRLIGKEALLIALPMKIAGGSGAPLRIIALVK